MHFPVILLESEEGFAVSCASLPGCKTREETLVNIREAITLWREVADEDAARELTADGVCFTRELVTI